MEMRRGANALEQRRNRTSYVCSTGKRNEEAAKEILVGASRGHVTIYSSSSDSKDG